MTRAALAAALALACPAAAQAPAAAEVAARFLAHLAANQPVAGEFRVDTDLDAAQQAGLFPPGVTPAPEPARQTLRCRWAWAAEREVCEALPGSVESDYGLLTLPEGTLYGVNDGQFNLTRAGTRRADTVRPALFYFYSGGDHWADQLFGAAVTTEPAAGRPEQVKLVARKAGATTVLVLDRATSRLRQAAVYYGTTPAWTLAIDEYAASPTDGRVFPRRAATATYVGGSATPLRRVRLEAVRVEFPTPEAAAGEFHLPVRAGALVGDRVQDNAIDVAAPTDGAALITQAAGLRRAPWTRPAGDAVLAVVPAPAGLGFERKMALLELTAVVAALAAGVAWLAWRLRRRPAARRPRSAARPGPGLEPTAGSE